MWQDRYRHHGLLRKFLEAFFSAHAEYLPLVRSNYQPSAFELPTLTFGTIQDFNDVKYRFCMPRSLPFLYASSHPHPCTSTLHTLVSRLILPPSMYLYTPYTLIATHPDPSTLILTSSLYLHTPHTLIPTLPDSSLPLYTNPVPIHVLKALLSSQPPTPLPFAQTISLISDPILLTN